ncbi:cbb3-type cytochrome oxidase assembly protein CcoS [Oceanospirillum linum]|uniref:cbb3-type cytochrome oxidase assembly protein CcoS n=1 Tax=Oceanospirillum linum TaxID=966 RepID=UPI00089EDE6F|nr:cbb3-type cytochrome oxidase assembly protein CcoS [Oceanospirillum linum]SEG28949.1 cytochrome oxidase maturation protein, cbb3-type [Oleiphilus messinensis]SMP26648.1 cytochrome oxidase maturation protein, cbb3-type [Oceanospirillum linum]
MSILFLLIPLSLTLLGVAIWAFFWAVDKGQFDDLSGPAYSILYDDDVKPVKKPSPGQGQQTVGTHTPEKTEISDTKDSKQP